MYRSILFTLFFLFPMYCNAQGVFTPALKDTLSLENVEERNRISYQIDDDQPYTGIIVDYHENGQVGLRKSVIDEKGEGIWIEWYETGVVRHLGEWKEGKGHGTWMYFYENGELRERSQVRDDLWHGISESWHKNGVKASQGISVNNARSGKWKFWKADGSIKEIKNFDEEL